MPKHRGSIVWFNPIKGFGFIQWAGGADIFCPLRAILPSDTSRLNDGSEVEFDITGPQGLQAENVILVRS